MAVWCSRTWLALALALVLGLAASNLADADERVQAGICSFSTTTTAHSRFATIKCAFADNPDNFVLRRTVERADDEAAYENLARNAGRTFRCDLERKGLRLRSDYTVRNCRR